LDEWSAFGMSVKRMMSLGQSLDPQLPRYYRYIYVKKTQILKRGSRDLERKHSKVGKMCEKFTNIYEVELFTIILLSTTINSPSIVTHHFKMKGCGGRM
jgi:hypothetical protein